MVVSTLCSLLRYYDRKIGEIKLRKICQKREEPVARQAGRQEPGERNLFRGFQPVNERRHRDSS
jgi:hypothetical protein